MLALGLTAPSLAGVGVKSVPIVLSTDGRAHSPYPAGDAPEDTEELAWSGVAGAVEGAGSQSIFVGTAYSFNVCPFLFGDEADTASLSIVDSTGDNPASEGWTLDADCGDGTANLAHSALQTGSGTFELRATGASSQDDSSIIDWLAAADPGDSGFDFPETALGTSSSEIVAVETFHNISLYWNEGRTGTAGNNTTNQALCRYREQGTATWYQCPTLWWENRASGTGAGLVARDHKQFRGSILHRGTELGVEPDTTYEIQLQTESSRLRATTTVTTWSESFTCGTTETINSGSTTQTISTSGAGNGSYHCVQPAGYTFNGTRTLKDMNHGSDYAVVINANWVIVRGLNCQEANESCIKINANKHHLVIEDNDLEEYGHEGGTPTFACNTGGGIETVKTGENLSTVALVIQNNHIHHPDFDANNWNESRSTGDGCGPEGDPVHAAGATAIYLRNTGGQVVIRYNTIETDLTHMHDDLIGGAQNFSVNGGIGPNSDIYENDLMGGWDECIETDGNGENVRVYDNLMRQCYDMLSSSGVSLGPLYTMRNIAYLSQKSPTIQGNNSSGAGNAGWLMKIRAQGSNQDAVGPYVNGQGKVYNLHNTVKRDSAATGVDVILQAVTGHELANITVYNNVLETNSAMSSAVRGYVCDTSIGLATADPPDWENNIYRQGHAIPSCDSAGDAVTPTYDPLACTNSPCSDTYNPAAGGPQQDTGTLFPGINDVTDGLPDRGAVERGQAEIEYGKRW